MEITDISTVNELAKQVGGRKKAVALLRSLEIPVVAGAFSQRLLLSRLEHRPESADPADAAAAALTRLGLVVVRIQRGHPTFLSLTVRSSPISIGQLEYEEGEASPFAPVVLRPRDRIDAVLYVASARSRNGTAMFLISGLDEEQGAPLVVLYLASEDRIWLPLRSEVREFYRTVHAGGRQPWFTQTPRPGALRVSLPRGRIDFDAELRVVAHEAP